MNNSDKKQERAIVYIDGFNLHFGLLASTLCQQKTKQLPKRCYWMDLQKVTQHLVQDRELVSVKYFPVSIKGNSIKQQRQNTFLEAMEKLKGTFFALDPHG